MSTEMNDLVYTDNFTPAHGNGPKRRVAVMAYVCHPIAGSEPGASWGMVVALSKQYHVTAFVQECEMDALLAWKKANPDESVEFVGIPQPTMGEAMLGMNRLASKLTLTTPLCTAFHWMAYFSWIGAARDEARQMHRAQPFDAAVHAAFGAYWVPSPAVDIGAPSVWGPVGGATMTPTAFWGYLGWKGICGEIWKRLAVRGIALLPPTRRTWHRATIRIAETEATRNALPKHLRQDTRVLNRSILQGVPEVPRPAKRESYLLFPSRLQPRKGSRLALQALVHTPASVTLHFVADGVEREALIRVARELGVADRVKFHGWLSRDRMFEMMVEAAAVMTVGLREEGGCTLSEAMQLGTPVVVLGVSGARLVAEQNTDPNRAAIIDTDSPEQAIRDMAAAMTKFSTNPSPLTDSYLNCADTENRLCEAVADAIAIGKANQSPRLSHARS